MLHVLTPVKHVKWPKPAKHINHTKVAKHAKSANCVKRLNKLSEYIEFVDCV